jgi:hypothetical protein
VNVTGANQSGSSGEGVVVGPKGINAWAPSASNNTCVPKGTEGIKSVAASSPALDFQEDRSYCVLGFTSDDCIGETVVGKEYKAPVVRLMRESYFRLPYVVTAEVTQMKMLHPPGPTTSRPISHRHKWSA